MSSIVCLWKYPNYLADERAGYLREAPSFNSHQSRLHSATELGERAYLVTYLNGHCYLVGRITITQKYQNEPDYEYGEFGIRGIPPESQYFDFDLIDITNILRRLNFKTGKKIGNSPRPISMHLQTIRELTEDDVALLESAVP
jgi:hypothetical protein